MADKPVTVTEKNEGYPPHWKHCLIHLDPRTGQMQSDGDHSVRHWIEERIKVSDQVRSNLGFAVTDSVLQKDGTHEVQVRLEGAPRDRPRVLTKEERNYYLLLIDSLKERGVNPDLAATTALKIMGIG